MITDKLIVILILFNISFRMYGQNSNETHCWLEVDSTEYFSTNDSCDSKTFIRKYFSRSDSSLYLIESYYDGKLFGNRLFFYPNGKILKIETYRNGVIIGKFLKYSNSGILLIEGDYGNGATLNNGSNFIGINESGNPDNPGYFYSPDCYSSPRQGKWIFYYNNGMKYTEGEYIDNKRIGTWPIYSGQTGEVIDSKKY